jgi:o-succinylbenzoate synthase
MSRRVALDDARAVDHAFAMTQRVANAKASWVERAGVLVRVEARGVVGWGEASPLPGYSAESLDDAKRALSRALPALGAIDLDRPPLDGVEDTLREVPADLAPTARFALETALLDLRARIEGVPLHRLLAPDAASDPLPISTLLVGDDRDALREAADRAIGRGIRRGKVKVGRPGKLDDELATVAALARDLGGALVLRLDANGAWSRDEAARALDALASLGDAIELVEEPVSGAEWLALPPPPVTLAIDETLGAPRGAAVAEEALARATCRVVVIKPSVVGGFVAARRVVDRARAHGAGVIVTHMFEGPIATAAAAALAVAFVGPASAGRPFAHGLDVRAYIDVAPEHPIGESALHPRTASGLGVTPS